MFVEELVSEKRSVLGNFTIHISIPGLTFQKRDLHFEVILKGVLRFSLIREKYYNTKNKNAVVGTHMGPCGPIYVPHGPV